MLALRYAALLALAVWVGGLAVLGGIAAPSVFDVIAARQVADGRVLAGAIFGETLRRFHLLSYACGGVLVVSLVARAVLGPRPRWFGRRLLVAAVMLAAAIISGVVVSGRIERARAEIGVAPSSLPETDPRREAFGRLHALSTALQTVPLAGGLLLILLDIRE